MAVAEARAAWQRTANRCFVQEDAKRAPKLACCPSASPPLKQFDGEGRPFNAADDGPDNTSSVCFLPFDRNPSFPNLPTDSRWWLQLQPTYGYQRGLMHEQLSNLEAEMEIIRSGVHGENKCDNAEVDDDMKSELSSFAPQSRVSAPCVVKNDSEMKIQELRAKYTKNSQEPLKDRKEPYELFEMDHPLGYSVLKKTCEHNFDSESPWIGAEKTEPWWRTADKDELASLVALKSLDPIENCDLPRPQNTHLGCFDPDCFVPFSLDGKGKAGDLYNFTVHTSDDLTYKSACAKQLDSAVRCSQQHGSDTKTRNGGDIPISSPHKSTGGKRTPESDSGKAQLLEALCHSQTRAREAENAAKQANAEKEHIIKLFFKQASHLFAYKQWFQLLQLENLCYQIKNNNQPISGLFPVDLPWTIPHRIRKSRVSRKTGKGSRGKPGGGGGFDIAKFAVAFALGLSLVSAGLLMGWTVGWMLPTF